MAKKVTINGENLLNGLEDDWGGVNESKIPVTVHNTTVAPNCEWGINRGEIERFIKKMFGQRVGCLKIAQDDQNTNVILGFTTGKHGTPFLMATNGATRAWHSLSHRHRFHRRAVILTRY